MTGLIQTAYAAVRGSGSVAEGVDSAFIFISAICAFFFLLTQGLLIYFAIKYRRRRAEDADGTPYITHNRLLETVWVIIPSIVVIAIFAYGYVAYRGIMQPAEGALEIDVTARQWMWEFKYPTGRKTVNELRVAEGEPVELKMGSEDVIHSLYIPDYRIKRDVVPGSYAVIGFTPGPPGEHHIFCAEFCGTGHSNMNATLIVMEPDAFHEWLESEGEAGTAPPAELGERLVRDYGCTSCHSTDGTKSIGPSFAGLYGRKAEFEDGTSLTADDDYILESMMDPKAKVVKGFPPVMPTYTGSLGPDERNAIIAYLKELGAAGGGHEAAEGRGEEPGHEAAEKATAPDPERGRELFGKMGCTACHSIDGSSGVGPSLKGLAGADRKLADGTSVLADEAYIRESILEPGARLVDGFAPVMPPFKDSLTDEQVADIIAYIETLK